MTVAERYFADLAAGVSEGPPAGLQAVVDCLVGAVRSGVTVFTCGNGASAALASHMACDLGKGSAPDLGAPHGQAAARRLRILSLGDNLALTTAYGNDVSYDSVFVEPLKNLARPGDVLIGISGSGGSPNVLAAMEYAKTNGLTTIGMTGRMPSAAKLAAWSDIFVAAPSGHMEQIEDWHVVHSHIIALAVRRELGTAPEAWR